ncbi:MAG: hypothetical protein HQK51_20535 [Oligoflexia bacterium]|nr:hypothetical protein [Oligoflexia bacterium]
MKNKRFSMLEVEKSENKSEGDDEGEKSKNSFNKTQKKNEQINDIKNNEIKNSSNIIIDETEFERNLQIHKYKKMQEEQEKEIEKTEAKLPDTNWAWIKIALGSQFIILGIIYFYYRFYVGTIPRSVTVLISTLTSAALFVFMYDRTKNRW